MQRLCACGCGQPTPVAKQTNKKIGHVKGEQVKYIRGHVWYKGGKSVHQKGYLMTKIAGHPRADHRGYVFDHVLIVEKIMGKPLPLGACVHHINENVVDNRPENLLVCQNNAYHKLIHQRTRAWEACGHANWRKCKFCKKYDSPDNLYISPDNKGVEHKSCAKKYYDDHRERINELQRLRRSHG